jgi:GNAT superfamily N-acetyltransferase
VRLRYRHYKKFSDVPERQRAAIVFGLGKPHGRMRRMACKFDPPCVVATLSGDPVAWAARFKRHRLSIHPRRPDLQVYVGPAYRRVGVGTSVLNRLLVRERLLGRAVYVHPETRAAKAFFDNCGFDP